MGSSAKLKIVWNISVMMPTKMSIPQTLCVRTQSSLSLSVSFSAKVSTVTAC